MVLQPLLHGCLSNILFFIHIFIVVMFSMFVAWAWLRTYFEAVQYVAFSLSRRIKHIQHSAVRDLSRLLQLGWCTLQRHNKQPWEGEGRNCYMKHAVQDLHRTEHHSACNPKPGETDQKINNLSSGQANFPLDGGCWSTFRADIK